MENRGVVNSSSINKVVDDCGPVSHKFGVMEERF